MSSRIRVYLADDHKIFVKGIANLLAAEPEIEVKGFGFGATDAIEFVTNNEIDLLITDIQMEPVNGIQLTQQIKNDWPEVKVIGLSMFDKAEIIKELLEAGADGYLLKDVEIDELIDAINRVFAGETVYSGKVATILMSSLESKDLLTKREKEILRLIAKEKTNIQIAEQLFISEHTVEAHRKNIFRKTKAKSVVGLVNYAYENKII